MKIYLAMDNGFLSTILTMYRWHSKCLLPDYLKILYGHWERKRERERMRMNIMLIHIFRTSNLQASSDIIKMATYVFFDISPLTRKPNGNYWYTRYHCEKSRDPEWGWNMPLSHRDWEGLMRRIRGAAKLWPNCPTPGRHSASPRWTTWAYGVSNEGKRSQGGHPASSALQGASWEANLGLTLHGSQGKSLGLDHWRSERNREDRAESTATSAQMPTDLIPPQSCTWEKIPASTSAHMLRGGGSPVWPGSSVDSSAWLWSPVNGAVLITETALHSNLGREANVKPHPLLSIIASSPAWPRSLARETRQPSSPLYNHVCSTSAYEEIPSSSSVDL